MAEPSDPPAWLAVSYGGALHRIPLDPSATTLGQLAERLAAECGVDRDTIKLLPPRARSVLRLSTAGNTDRLAVDAGLAPGMRVMMVASRPGEVAAALAQRDLPRMRGFAEEEVLLATRRRRSSAVAAGPPPPGERFTFGRFETWETPGLNPPSATALALLHRLAADPGILGIMRRHQWSVGLLKEMPPEGKVGISPVCILGLNVNKGQEIHLRLRTDDLAGFRRYRSIRDTLCHELAHMVWSEHDSNFKALNSQLLRDCADLCWHGDGAAANSHTLGGPMYEGDAFVAEGEPAGGAGFTLREWMADPGKYEHYDPKTAAAEAAMRRLTGLADTPAAPGPPEAPQPAASGQAGEEEKAEGSARGAEPPVGANEPAVPRDRAGCEDEEMGDATEAAVVDGMEDVRGAAAASAGSGGWEGGAAAVAAAEGLEDGSASAAATAENTQPPSGDVAQEGSAVQGGGSPAGASLDIPDDPTAQRFRQVEATLSQLLRSLPADEAAAVVKTLQTILRNVLEVPQEDRYRQLKCSSRAFQSRVARHAQALEVLRAAGFTFVSAAGADAPGSYCLTRNDPGLVWLILSAVQQTGARALPGPATQAHG